jgi:hypothetical protein
MDLDAEMLARQPATIEYEWMSDSNDPSAAMVDPRAVNLDPGDVSVLRSEVDGDV